MRGALLPTVGLLALGTMAAAREVAPEEAARLRAGEVVVEVTPGVGRAQHVWAAEDIDAPPETVWAVMTDCSQALRYVPRLKTCDVVDADPSGRWDVRRQRLGGIAVLPEVEATFRLDYERPRAMRFRQVGGEMGGTQGEWRLTPLDGGRATRVVYEAQLSVPTGVPAPIARAFMRADAPAALQGLRRRSLAARGRSAP